MPLICTTFRRNVDDLLNVFIQFLVYFAANMATKRKVDVTVPAEESDQLLIRPL